jgi:hypothetical protein
MNGIAEWGENDNATTCGTVTVGLGHLATAGHALFLLGKSIDKIGVRSTADGDVEIVLNEKICTFSRGPLALR